MQVARKSLTILGEGAMEQKVGLAVFIVCCVVWQAQAQSAVNCTSAGRFADPSDTTCQNYTFCVYDSSTGRYLSYNYVCPTTSLFNPNTRQCTASGNYVCNVTTTNNTTNSSSVCTKDGYVADPDSTNCTTYVDCVKIDGAFVIIPYSCPIGTYFNPNTTYCESDYKCITFTCTEVGRFANTDDSTCQTYYFCVLQSNGTYVQYEYTCPLTSVFSPTARMCTTSYTCTGSAPTWECEYAPGENICPL